MADWAKRASAIWPIHSIRGARFLKADYHRLAARRGNMIAKVAVGRKLLTLVFYGIRDGEIRCLAERAA
jgi:hypothetical protein